MKKVLKTLSLILALLFCVQALPALSIGASAADADAAGAAPYAAATFKEITDELTIEYCTDDRDNFKPLPSGKDVANLCGIRISTNNSNFYLKYKSMNGAQLDWLDPVYSTKSGIYDYAGLPNKPMTQLAIEVYTTGGTRIYDDYVVMYRAKVPNYPENGGWLNWVSNGWDYVMQTVAGDFSDTITGDLDTGISATFAGWPPYGNIQALEIRMFERIEGNISSSGGSTAPVEAGDFQLATDITMKYRETGSNTWTTFGTSDTVSFSNIDGILLEAPGKPYYFSYAAKDKTTGWNPYVSSQDADVNDHKNGYAGYAGRPITNISIEVHTAGGRDCDNYIVMYRAKAGGKWLPWVSNGWPPIMKSIMSDADLDADSTNAGDGRYGPIQALEIRVYERKGMDPIPSENAVLIDAPYINQYDENLRNGCESTSTVMALQHAVGTDKISLSSFLNNYLDWTSSTPSPSRNRGPDPSKVYMGNPFPGYNDSSWGCFSPVIKKAVGKLENVIGVKATDVSETSLQNLCSTYIDKGIPVVMWATVGMTSTYKVHTWVTPEGKSISYNGKLHCLLLIGYDENNYFFNDPMTKKIQGYSKASVEKAYDALDKQAIVITKTSGGGTAVTPPKDTTIEKPVEIPKKPALPDEKVQDPIDLSTGAHVIDHTLMTVSGAQTLNFDISYRSNVLKGGSVGSGWSHNFEKRIVDDNTALYIYDSPAYYAVYKKTAANENVFKSDTVTKQNYTATRIPAEEKNTSYVVNCGDQSTEYYDYYGRLTKITGKTGLNTLITYPNDSTVIITDEISGRYMQLEKSSDGKITSVTDNTGRTCKLGYLDGNLVSITDENGEILSYQYNEKGQIERGRDQNGTVYFTDTYDSAGRVISQKDAISDSTETVIRYDEATDPDYLLVSVTDRTMQTTVYKYNDQKQLVSKTDPNGVETKYAYDSHGNLTKKTDGLGNSVVNAYDTQDNLISSTDKLGNKTEYTYDAKNNLTKVQYPGGGTVTKTYDSKNLLTSSTDLRGVTTTYTYNAQNLLTKASYAGRAVTYAYTKGQPTTVTDPMGRTTTKTYNEAGFLMSVTDAQDNTTSYTYDNKGNVLTVTDAAGNVTSKEYDAGGSLIKSTDAKGNATSYTYNGNLKMTSMTLPNGKTIRYTYDGEDRLIRTSYPDDTQADNTYDAGGRLISQTDRDGNTTAFEYDAANNLIEILNPLGGVIKKTYDAASNLLTSTEVVENYDNYYFEPDGTFSEHTTSYTYDLAGRLTKTTNAVGGETVYTYNTAGDLLSVTDPVGNQTTNTYDDLGNLLTVTDPKGNTTAYTYDKVGNLLTVENALGQIITNTYDSLNRLVSTKDPGGHVVSYTYDDLGRMQSRTDARGNTIHQYYDALGNIIKVTDESDHIDFEAVYNEIGKAATVTDAAGSTTINEYDWEGNLSRQTDALHHTMSYTYNGGGQIVSAVDKAGGISYATYDGMGNLTSMTGPGGSEKAYSYNTNGRMYGRNLFFEGDVELHLYNALGLKDKVVGARWQETNYTYDKAGRLTKQQDNAGTVTYTYDANGNVLTASDSTGTVRREYDALNRVSKYTDIYGNVIEYTYDVCGNLASMRYPTGKTAVYAYDANHNMVSSGIEGETCTTTYEYNKENQITKIIRPDGSVTTKSYDNAGRLKEFTDKDKNGKIITSGIYGYDALGRIEYEICAADNLRYEMTYDALGRVTERTEYNLKTGAVNHTETFSYDSAGNILTAVSPDGTENSYEYEENNIISKRNETGIGVTTEGNTTSCEMGGKKVELRYDTRNRLKQIDGDNNEYWYDADGTRINMYYSHTNMKYTYDCSGGRNRLVWTSDHNEKESIYGYGAEGLLWSESDGAYQIYHYDYRGSVVAVTDMDGNVTDRVKYDAYGSVVERTGDSALIFGYNGQYGVLTDPNGLLYMRTRFYNPDLKRFMNADIIDGTVADSTTLNVFAYVNGNPISFVDPFGLSAERGENENPFGNRWTLEDQQKAFETWDKAGRPSISNRLAYSRYKDVVLKALENTADDIIAHYKKNYKTDVESRYASYIDTLYKVIGSTRYNLPLKEFEAGMKVRIEIEEAANTSLLNVVGDFAGFVPVLGEIYTLVDIMSEENADLSELGSVLMSAIMEKDIAKLTPYADVLGKLGDFSNTVNAFMFIYDCVVWNSSENIKPKISIYIQQGQHSAFKYETYVNKDNSFKEMWSGFTGTVIKPEEGAFTVIYK